MGNMFPDNLLSIKSYTKWYHYVWAMPIVAVFLFGVWVSNKWDNLKRTFITNKTDLK